MKYPNKIAIGFQEGTCPLQCPKCYAFSKNAKQKKAVQKMPMDKAILLIDEIAKMEKHPKLQPHIYTEPFANNDLKDIILRCREKDIPMSIISNGVLFNEDWINFFIENTDRKFTLSFSLDALSQSVYEKVRGNYNLAQIEESILSLSNKRGTKGPRVGVNFGVEKDNYFEAAPFLEKWKYLVDAVRMSVIFDEKRQIPDFFRGENSKLNNMFRIGREKITIQECGYLNSIMTIDAGGEVRTCQNDAFGSTYFGNVFEEGIMGVWNGKKLREYKEKQKNKQITQEDFCYGCEFPTAMTFVEEETDEFIINRSDYSFYYNRKNNSFQR